MKVVELQIRDKMVNINKMKPTLKIQIFGSEFIGNYCCIQRLSGYKQPALFSSDAACKLNV